MTITDKELSAIERNTLNTENARVMARELRAARKVVRLLKRAHAGYWVKRLAVAVALDAYDKARNGKVT
jgi:hypothetical protein